MAVINQIITDKYALYHGDSCEVLPNLPASSVGYSLYSPPFLTPKGGALYHYSSSPRDISNARTLDEGLEHYGFIVNEIFRLTMPGRVTSVHCSDVPSGNSGCDHLFDLPGEIIRLHERIGFKYFARTIVWKEPLLVRNRTLTKGLAHKTIVDDSAKCSNAGADFILHFRRDGENTVPIAHPQGLMEYAGEDQVPAELHQFKGWKGKQTENRYSHWIWRRYASSVWMDVRIDRVLPFKEAKDENDERHCHPLQLDVIERCLQIWSNPSETILTPFMGVGSEVYGAVRAKRRGIGVELKASYFRQAVRNVEHALSEHEDENTKQQLLFDATQEEVSSAKDIA